MQSHRDHKRIHVQIAHQQSKLIFGIGSCPSENGLNSRQKSLKLVKPGLDGKLSLIHHSRMKVRCLQMGGKKMKNFFIDGDFAVNVSFIGSGIWQNSNVIGLEDWLKNGEFWNNKEPWIDGRAAPELRSLALFPVDKAWINGVGYLWRWLCRWLFTCERWRFGRVPGSRRYHTIQFNQECHWCVGACSHRRWSWWEAA